jgi:hypothetical protein
MTLERSAAIMDDIFASPEEEGRGRLLRIMQEFLVSEALKHSAKEKGGNLEDASLFKLIFRNRKHKGQIQTVRCRHG